MPEVIEATSLEPDDEDPKKDADAGNGKGGELVPVERPGDLEAFNADSAIHRYHEAMRFLQEVCKGDWLELGGKHYLRIEGLQKLANALSLSTTIVERWESSPKEGVREWWYRVDCAGPRRITSGIGCCSSAEKFARGKDPSAIAGMALTRATGSAIRRYFGLTGPSAEEMEGGDEEAEHAAPEPPARVSPKQIGMIMALATELGARNGWDAETSRAKADEWIYATYKVDTKSKLTAKQASKIIDTLLLKKNESEASRSVDATTKQIGGSRSASIPCEAGRVFNRQGRPNPGRRRREEAAEKW